MNYPAIVEAQAATIRQLEARVDALTNLVNSLEVLAQPEGNTPDNIEPGAYINGEWRPIR